jgi:hypothetical protein
MEKPSLQSIFTFLPSKFFPAKYPFSKIQKKKLAGKNLLCKGTRSFFILSNVTKVFKNPCIQKLAHCIVKHRYLAVGFYFTPESHSSLENPFLKLRLDRKNSSIILGSTVEQEPSILFSKLQI